MQELSPERVHQSIVHSGARFAALPT